MRENYTYMKLTIRPILEHNHIFYLELPTTILWPAIRALYSIVHCPINLAYNHYHYEWINSKGTRKISFKFLPTLDLDCDQKEEEYDEFI